MLIDKNSIFFIFFHLVLGSIFYFISWKSYKPLTERPAESGEIPSSPSAAATADVRENTGVDVVDANSLDVGSLGNSNGTLTTVMDSTLSSTVSNKSRKTRTISFEYESNI